MKVTIEPPKVPDYVFVRVPGANRRSKVAISEMSRADVEAMGQAWTDQALEKAGHAPTPDFPG